MSKVKLETLMGLAYFFNYSIDYLTEETDYKIKNNLLKIPYWKKY